MGVRSARFAGVKGQPTGQPMAVAPAARRGGAPLGPTTQPNAELKAARASIVCLLHN